MKLINSIFNVLRFNQRNWKAVVLCIFAATVFWFFNALNKTYTTNLRFPLSFDYDHDNFVPVKALPRDIRINVTGNGWVLFRRSTGVKIPPLEIPVERPLDTRKIVGSTLPAFFVNQIEGLEINYVLTDTLYVNLEPKAGRWIHLKLDTTKLRLKEEFGLASGISIMPDSIFIEGPKPVITNLNDTVSITIPFTDIDERFSEDVEVSLPSLDVIRRDPPTVHIMFNVQKMVTIKDSITLVIQNLPDNVLPIIGRKRIPVEIAIPQNMTDEFILDSMRAILDLAEVKRGSRMVMPEVSGLPPFSKVISIDSVRIKF
jgi:hypothetical protein